MPAGELQGATGEHAGGGPGDAYGGHTGARASAWASVLLLVVGFTLCALALPVQTARVPLLIVGAVTGLVGVVLAVTSGLMDNVE